MYTCGRTDSGFPIVYTDWCTDVLYSGYFSQRANFHFFHDGENLQNYTRENFPCMRMHVHGAGTHLRCVNDKPTNKFRNTFIYAYAKIYHCEKYPLYGTVVATVCNMVKDSDAHTCMYTHVHVQGNERTYGQRCQSMVQGTDWREGCLGRSLSAVH